MSSIRVNDDKWNRIAASLGRRTNGPVLLLEEGVLSQPPNWSFAIGMEAKPGSN
jgi:hypothetical protein